MSDESAVPAVTNAFERIKRKNERGGEFWSARELARVLEYSEFRNFISVINKAREACVNSGHPVADHFVDITELVSIGSNALRPVTSRGSEACHLSSPHSFRASRSCSRRRGSVNVIVTTADSPPMRQAPCRRQRTSKKKRKTARGSPFLRADPSGTSPVPHRIP